ncbi:MAG: hypothetical protein GXX96_19360 [Planctomycetaceae bacterium]|nr:hypothetical protein [Planctomycetaceae bacterium]
MKDLLMIGLFLIAWIALNRWVLPAMGIQTCMSGGCCGQSCQVPAERAVVPASNEETEQDPSAADEERLLVDRK